MTIDSTLAQRKNAQVNIPLTLYRIQISDNAEEDLFLTDWHTDVEHLGQVYQAFPMVKGAVSENTEGRIDTLTVTIANQNRNMQYFVENYNALRGRKVTIIDTFYEELANPNGYTLEIYYVDGASCDENEINFTLTSRLDVLSIRLPRRRFLRDFCPWTYKREGCWINSPDYQAPDGFISTAGLLYGLECSGRYFGGAGGVVLSNDRFQFDPLYATNYFMVAEGGVDKIDYLKHIDPPVGGISVGTRICIRRRYDQIGQIRVLKNQGGTGQIKLAADDYLKDREEFILLEWDGDAWEEVENGRRKSDWAVAKFAPQWFPPIDKSTQKLIIDMKVSDASSLGSSRLEISSAGQSNASSWYFDDVASLGLTTEYQTIEIPLADFTQVGDGPDFSTGVNWLGWRQVTGDGSMIRFWWKAARIDGQPDTCGKRLADCKLHNNVARFGGFPNVPSWRSTRV